ncbi:hypothetical protein vseg_018142 [Gypsophila vaccaria]
MLGFYAARVLFEVEENVFYAELDHLFANDQFDAAREVVSIKQMRPCPPNGGSRNFSVGDLVQVFANDGWWVGEVVGHYHAVNCFDVLLDGVNDVVFVEICDMRSHQIWEDDRWVVVLD